MAGQRDSKNGHNSALCPLHPLSSDQRQSFTLFEFRDAFPGEGQHIEFKSSPSRDPLTRSVVAFSNATGGVILVGVDDHGQPCAGRGHINGWMKAVHESIGTTRDHGKYHLRTVIVDDKYVVLAVCVNERLNGFAQTSGGIPLVRRGEEDVPVFGGDLAEMVLSKMQTRYDETAVVSDAEVDDVLLTELMEVYGIDPTTNPNDFMRSQGFVMDGPARRLTVAGTLFLTRRPGDVLGKAFVEIRRYPDDTTANYDRREMFDGPLQEQIIRATEFLADELGEEFVVSGLYRYLLPKMPKVALREAICNAVAHRAYENSGTAVVIELRPGNVIITSPGGLLEPVTEDNLREMQAARNPRIINVLRRFRLAEDAGRGIGVIEDQMSAALLDAPKFRDHGHAFEVTLPIHSAIAPEERAWVVEVTRQGGLEPPDRYLLIHTAREGKITNATARMVLGVDQVTARQALHRLRDAGLLAQFGERGGAYYVLNSEMTPPTFRMTLAQLLDYLVEQARESPLTNARVRDLAKVDRDDALALLTNLVELGRLVQIGERRGTRYVLPDSEAAAGLVAGQDL